MKTVTREFFTVAIDQTNYYDKLPRGATRAFGLYLVCKDEATYCCSLSPSSWGVNLQNVFTCKMSDSDTLHSEMESGEWEMDGLDDSYISFQNYNAKSGRHSELVSISIETDLEFDETDGPLPESVHDELWEEAREYFSGNQYLPACCDYEQAQEVAA